MEASIPSATAPRPEPSTMPAVGLNAVREETSPTASTRSDTHQHPSVIIWAGRHDPPVSLGPGARPDAAPARIAPQGDAHAPRATLSLIHISEPTRLGMIS